MMFEFFKWKQIELILFAKVDRNFWLFKQFDVMFSDCITKWWIHSGLNFHDDIMIEVAKRIYDLSSDS